MRCFLSRCLWKTSITGFEPMTDGNNRMERKTELKKILEEKIENLEKLKNQCRGKKLSLKVCFNLYDDDKNEGRAKKDLDNLLKILLDTLPNYMDKNEDHQGLGLIPTDNKIFHIDCKKRIIKEKLQEGIDLQIFEYTE